MPRPEKTDEEKKAIKRMYNETYYQKHKDQFKTYYQTNKELLGYGRFQNPKVGIYALKNRTTDHVYVGASKNVVGRWRAHKVSTLKAWDDIAPAESWYYELVCELPSYLDCQAMNHFEWLEIAALKKAGVPVLNNYNSNVEKDAHILAIEDMMGALSESSKQWVQVMLASLH